MEAEAIKLPIIDIVNKRPFIWPCLVLSVLHVAENWPQHLAGRTRNNGK
jgi:hypothetical protein